MRVEVIHYYAGPQYTATIQVERGVHNMLWFFFFVCRLGENNNLFTDDRERNDTEQQKEVSNECSYVLLATMQ